MRSEKQLKTDQKTHWDGIFAKEAAFFGEEPSDYSRKALELFRREGVHEVLELGCGQGRDTFYFARNNLRVTALDYAETAVATLREKAAAAGLSASIDVCAYDVRQPLSFADASFDACYSHMLLCMDLATDEIAFILGEIRRVLRPGGLALYSLYAAISISITGPAGICAKRSTRLAVSPFTSSPRKKYGSWREDIRSWRWTGWRREVFLGIFSVSLYANLQ
nr:class I SAM-dependent methyltransferase [Geoalkalibacter subterraneus]